MIVVDTNVIAYLFIRGTHSDAVDRLLASEPDWIAPRLWLDEFLNVLATQERSKLIDAASSNEILRDACLLMQDASYELPAERILSTARRTGCTAYDSQYVTLAEDLGLPLYTFDKRLIGNCPNIAQAPPSESSV